MRSHYYLLYMKVHSVLSFIFVSEIPYLINGIAQDVVIVNKTMRIVMKRPEIVIVMSLLVV